MRAILRRTLCAFLTACLALGAVPPAPTAASAGQHRRTVIIVGEPSFEDGQAGGAALKGTGEGAESALFRHLAGLGYEPGLNLFEVTVSGLRDLDSGALQVASAVKSALSRSAGVSQGPPECDIVASGLSGLIARYALEKGFLGDLNVANLVMVSAPNRGTFLADVVKLVLEIVRQESLLEKETRVQRLLPSLKDLLGSSPEDAPASVKSLTQARALAAPELEDEASWISHRSHALWEPLYAHYVKDRYFAIPYVPSQSPKETFAGWVRRTLPDVWRRLIVEASWPKPAPQGLSLPYYEYLAMEVAKNQYAMRRASGGNLVAHLLKEPYLPPDWEDFLAHYGGKILLYYAEKALPTLKAEAQEFIAHRAVKFTGLGNGPQSPFISNLIKEDLLINLGTSSSKRFERIPANLSLDALNSLSRAASINRRTRYVSVCSRLANPWGLIWPQLAPNDCLLEVDSSVAPVGPGDLVAVFGGFLRMPGNDLLDDRRARDYIAEVLSGPAAPRVSEPEGSGPLRSLDVSSWEPLWCPVGTARRITLSVAALPDGWQCQVWEEPGEQSPMWAFSESGTYPLLLSPNTERLGMRLIRSGPMNPVVGNAVVSAYADETKVRVFVSFNEETERAESPGSGDAGGEASGDGAHETGDPGSGSSGKGSVGDSETDPGSSGGADSGGGIGSDSGGASDPLPSDEADSHWPEDLPTVRVVYRSKHTTLWKPKETFHDFWLIDFGDGSNERVEGDPSLAVDHTYSAPGTYGVRAESYGNDGKLLYKKEWTITVALPGETRRFECQSVPRLTVDLTLDGPRKWVTGKRAVFTAKAKVDLPQNAEVVFVEYDPGPVFGVIWERAGDFVVSCAASINVKYLLEGAVVEVENTYVREVPVTVLTTGVTR